jgi:aryl-alcohol dehydrogenase-like predicted oxidoreductase
MTKRKIGPFAVEPVGLGCMSLNHGYAAPPSPEDGARRLNEALDLGYDFLDTATIYGLGRNEELIGKAVGHRRREYVLASKCGIVIEPDGKRYISCMPDVIHSSIDASLKRLGVDHIDLYYLHRRDFSVPIEDSVGALAEAVKAGKIGSIGLSEMSAETLRKAAAVHPIAAMQTEYSLWTRNPEIAVLDACAELGTSFVAFSPVGRGFLAGAIDAETTYGKGDMRAPMPRFIEPNLSANLALLEKFRAIAAGQNLSLAQLSIAWVINRAPHIVTIPGSANAAHIADNFAARDVLLPAEVMAQLDGLINQQSVSGGRYAHAMQSTIDTEEFAA